MLLKAYSRYVKLLKYTYIFEPDDREDDVRECSYLFDVHYLRDR